MKGRISWIGLLIACSIGVCSGAAAAQPAAPPAGYKIEEKYTKKSPDGATTVEQYLNKDTDDWKWQFWARWQDTFTLLDPEPAPHPAAFIFTNELKWIVRVQKTGSGESTLYLYRLDAHGFVPASKNSLGVDWPANRYLLITLWGEADVKGRKREQTSVVHDWRCRYDLQTGKFDVPALFSADNAKAVVPQ